MLFANQMNLLSDFPFFLFFVGLFPAAAIVRVLKTQATAGYQHVQIEMLLETGEIVPILFQVLAMSVHQKETLFQSHLQGLLNGGVLQGIHHDEFAEKVVFGNSKRRKKPTAREQQPAESSRR
jgi:hypothetical protein